jgi:hypothetical protein
MLKQFNFKEAITSTWMLIGVLAFVILFQQIAILKIQRRAECERYEMYATLAEAAIFSGQEELLEKIHMFQSALAGNRGPEEYEKYCERY